MNAVRPTCPRCGLSNVAEPDVGMPTSGDAVADLEPWQRHMGCVVKEHDRECHDCAYQWSSHDRGAFETPEQPLTTLAGTVAYAADVHADQVDKGGAPYIGHVLRVWQRVWSHDVPEEIQMAALLHDTIEDHPVTEAGLAALGTRTEVIRLVSLLTRTVEVADEDYYARIAADPDARLIKLADVADNSDPRRLALLDAAVRARLVAKYANARILLGADDG